jgi:DNA-binding GntR family transcriptional regulator
VLDQLKVKIDRARQLTVPAPGRMNKVIGEHLVIRDAVTHRDVASASVRCAKHLSNVILDVDRLHRQNPDFLCLSC